MDNISYSTVALKTSCQYKTLNEQESLRVVYAEQAWITHNGWWKAGLPKRWKNPTSLKMILEKRLSKDYIYLYSVEMDVATG